MLRFLHQIRRMLPRMSMAAALCSFALLITACENGEKTEEMEGSATTAPAPGAVAECGAECACPGCAKKK